MAKWKTDLAVVCIDDLAADGRGFWKINAPLVFESDIIGRIEVEVGFLTDFASVPRAPILYTLFGDTAHKSAVIHDWLFHHHERCDQQTANRVFLEAMAAEGIPAWRRYLIYAGVVVGASSSWDDDGRGDGHSIIDGEIV